MKNLVKNNVSELEKFKENHLKKINEVSKIKTEWLKSFQEVYQENRSRISNYKNKPKSKCRRIVK